MLAPIKKRRILPTKFADVHRSRGRAPRVLPATLPASSSRRRYLRYSRASSRSSGRHQEGRRDRSPATDEEAEPLVVGDPWPRSRASELLAVFMGRVAGGIVSFGDLVSAPVRSCCVFRPS